MAVRIQMRRGTTSQWNDADPVLNSGEIGYNETLGAFKVGDGSTVWSSLDYYQATANITPAEVGAIALTEKNAANGVATLDGSKNVITASKVVFEGATEDAYEAYIELGAEPASADITLTLPTTSGIFVTSDTSGNVVISGDLTVNGTTTTIDTTHLQIEDKNIILGYGATSDAAVDGGGITLTGATNKTFNWVDTTDAWTSSEHMNLASGKSYYMNGTLLKDVSETLTNKTLSAAVLSGTLTADSSVGSAGQYLESTGTGVRWTTVSGYSAPTIGSTSIASGATVTTIAGLTLTSPILNTPTLTLSTTSSTTDGVVAWDATNDKLIIGDGTTAREFASSTLITNAQTGTTYTFVLADKDKIVELNNASAISVSIPTNASVAYPVGTQINILQTGAGQVTVAAATPATTTVNGTPGLKLRAQWSSATLIKRATDTWVAVGDLSA